MSIACVICKTDIDALDFLIHIPSCYYNHCKAKNTTPLCTCDSCKGVRCHINPTIEEFSTQTELGKRKIDLGKETGKNKKTSSKSNYNKWTGKECFYCGKKSPDCDFPILHVGKYRQIRFCKKMEINNPMTIENIASEIDDELEVLKTKGDRPQTVLNQSGNKGKSFK